MSPSLSPARRIGVALLVAAVVAAGGGQRAAAQVVPGTNVNMVSGTGWPDGDPYLQRQNEPSSAVSTRNPLHILAGANDYRTVDLPGPFDPLRGEKNNADAWVGLFKSLDGGQTWRSTLVPGYPQDPSPEGLASPLHGRQAATDPVVRAGTHGLFYYAGLAFDRGENAPSTIFVARFVDLNNVEAGDPIAYLDTRVVDSDGGTRFLDKTALAVDVPRGTATCTISAPLGDGTFDTRTIPAGNVYVAYTAFTGSGATQTSRIMFSRSTDCGATWSTPRVLSTGDRLVQNAQIAVSPVDGAVYVSWRRFRSGTQDDGLYISRSVNGGATFLKPVRIAPVRPFDQGTTGTSFRTNAFQTMTIDATGRVYVAWSQRGHSPLRPNPVTGDAKIVLSTSTNGTYWSTPTPIDADDPGHQLMPALSFHAGRLQLLYYDLREDVSQVFAPFVDDFDILLVPPTPRHTMDVFVAQALPGAQPVFTSVRLSDYAMGYFPGSDTPQRLQYNPPNLPLFRQGTAPFMGDYIDLAPAPPFVQRPDGVWVSNTAPGTAPMAHAFWTDNRDVRAPRDGNWQNYTPVLSDAVGTQSRFDPTQMVPPCVVGQTGMRNQNIYTARVTEGLFAGSPGNSKPLGTIPRTFVVLAQNASAVVRSYRLTIDNQPPGGYASFVQIFTPGTSPLTVLDVSIPPLSSVSRSVFVSSTDPSARVNVTLSEITAPGAPASIPGGLTTTVVLNADPTNPRLENPRLENPGLPDIDQAEVYNPNITTAVIAIPRLENPRLENPSMEAPRLENEGVETPRLENDAVANPTIINPGTTTTAEAPRLENPRLENPRLENVDLTNAGISDTSWVIKNEGNTTASYTINLVSNSPLPAGFTAQLVLHQLRLTPSAQDCTLAEQPDLILLANITDPQFVPLSEATNPRLENPRLENATLALAPGETAIATLRVVDPNRFDGVTFDAGAAVTPATVAHAVNTEDAAHGITQPPVAIPLTITTFELAPTAPGTPYDIALGAFAGSGPMTWEVSEGALPPGLTLDSTTGVISGTPTTPGNYVFTVRSTDANGNVDTQVLSIQVNPDVPAGFNRLWNGASPDWFDPRNWSPNGVPLPGDNVYIPASIATSPQLTRDATVHDLFVEDGATLDTNGFRLTVTGNARAGQTIVGGGTTVLTGVGATASGVFSNLRIEGIVWLVGPLTATGDLTMAAGAILLLNEQTATVAGQLRASGAGGILPIIEDGDIVAGDVDVQGLALHSAPLVINGGQLMRLESVWFTGFAPSDVQLTVNHPGRATPIDFSGLTFFSTPTTGAYISANDTAADAVGLVINISGAVPADGSARTQTTGGAVVNWLFEDGADLAVFHNQGSDDPIGYSVVVMNGGPQPAVDTVLTFDPPDAAVVVSATPSVGTCGAGGAVVACSLGSLAPGAIANVTIVISDPGAGDGLSTAQVSSSATDPNQANNTHTYRLVTPPADSVDLTLTKSDSADPVAPNAPFSYTLTVTNAGATPASGVVLVDALPAGVTAGTATASIGTCAIGAAQVVCDIGTIAAGQAATVTISALANAPGLLTNVAVVTSIQPELSAGDNIASEQTMVAAAIGCAVPSVSPPTTVPISIQAEYRGRVQQVAVGDFNDDDAPDIVALVPSGVGIVLNDGNGGTLPATIFGHPDGAVTPVAIVVEDFTGDGLVDVAALVHTDTEARLRVLRNDGTGFTWLAPVSFAPGSGSNWVLRSAVIDADADRDLLLVMEDSATVVALVNNGDGTFATSSAWTDTSPLRSLAVGDLNGDGLTDFVAGAQADARFTVVLAQAGGEFTPLSPTVTPANPTVWLLHDLTADGRLDLVTTESGQLIVYPGDGQGGFPQRLGQNVASSQIAGAADVNGDGRMDLFGGGAGVVGVAVYLGDGNGNFAAPVNYVVSASTAPVAVDLNDDLLIDFVVGDWNGAIHALLANCGAQAVDLRVSVDESADPVNEGTPITYAVAVTNAGATSATGVQLNVTFANGGSVPSTLGTSAPADATCQTFSDDATCTIAEIPAGAVRTFQFTTVVNWAATVRFSAGVLSAGAESTPADNSAFEDTTVTDVGAELVVTNTNDSGAGSLRQAMTIANIDAGFDQIAFNIPGAGPHRIAVLSALPVLVAPVAIDGTTQPGYVSTPLIELDGTAVNTGPASSPDAIVLTGGNSVVTGLAINSFGGSGIRIQGPGNNQIQANFIGTNASGTAALPNGRAGIRIVGSPGNVVGGTSPAARNLLSGNADGISIADSGSIGNQVIGNYIGTDVTGTQDLGNISHGILIDAGASSTIIGGAAPGSGNVVSGNRWGLSLHNATNTFILGNLFGLNAAGTAALGNDVLGINVSTNSSTTVVGGATAAERNVISGNGDVGLIIDAGATLTLVRGNYIGTDISGLTAVGNVGAGIVIRDSANNIIGQPSAGAGNVISGNGQGIFLDGAGTAANVIQGNIIGPNANRATLGNGGNGISIDDQVTSTLIGGATLAEGNLIAGNTDFDILIEGSFNTIQGNAIGFDPAVTQSLSSAQGGGIFVGPDASNNLIGGLVGDSGNRIAGILSTNAAILINGDENSVYGNFIGTNGAGGSGLGNGGHGIVLSDLASLNQIGAPVPGAGNVIGGSGFTGILVVGSTNGVQGNRIGTDVTGSIALPNGDGIFIGGLAQANTIGGIGPLARNIISGNRFAGVRIAGADNVVIGNYIGTNAAGTAALPNDMGVATGDTARRNRIGGTLAGEGNLISGNTQHGIGLFGRQVTETRVEGNLIGTDASGNTALPNRFPIAVDSSGNTIGGPTAAAGNVIAGAETEAGVYVSALAENNLILSNLIGTNRAGTAAIPNGTGIWVDGPNNIIGQVGAGNTISGSAFSGIGLGATAVNTTIAGNAIGTTASRTAPLPNLGEGIRVLSSGNTISQNLIAHNDGGSGIVVFQGTGTTISLNQIRDNNGLGIDLQPFGVLANDPGDADTGPNNLQNYPTLSNATSTSVTVTLDSIAGRVYTIELFRSPSCDPSGNGEGAEPLASSVINPAQTVTQFTVDFAPLPAGTVLTATATSADGTSEFSPCVTIPGAGLGADLSIVKTDSTDAAQVGVQFTYTLVVTNNGPGLALSTTVFDTVSSTLTVGTVTTTTGSCGLNGNQVTCSLGTLAASQSATITIPVTATEGGLVTNTANVASETLDPVQENNSDSTETMIVGLCSTPGFSAPRTTSVLDGELFALVVAELNDDDAADVVVSSQSARAVGVVLNDGGGNLQQVTRIDLGFEARGLAVADFTGDGRVDIAVVGGDSQENNARLTLLVGDGAGTFVSRPPEQLVGFPFNVRHADFDRDGDQDLAVVSLSTQGPEIFLNDGQGTFNGPLNVETDPDPVALEVGDIDGDGHVDLVVSHQQTPFVTVVRGLGAAEFADPVNITTAAGARVRLLADLNGDGNLDLGYVEGGSLSTSQAFVRFGDGDGGFGSAVDVGVGEFAHVLTAGDVNSDGHPDLITSHPATSTIAVQLGDGNGGFAAPDHFVAPVFSNPAVGAIIDDGRLQIAVGDSVGQVHHLRNLCGGPAVNLAVSLSDSADPVNEGAPLAYVMSVTNGGAEALGFTEAAFAYPPARLSLQNIQGSLCTTHPGLVRCPIPTLSPGATAQWVFNMLPLVGGTHFVSATTTAIDGVAPVNHTDIESTTVNAVGGTIVVTNANNAGPGSLREAIAISNADVGDRDTITFNINSPSPTIAITGDSLFVTQPVVIDGTTQPGFSGTPIVEVSCGDIEVCFLLTASDSVIRGLIINRAQIGIGLFGAGGTVIAGNYIGTDRTGTQALGVAVGVSVDNGIGNVIGGAAPGAGNLISGASSSGIFLGPSAGATSILGNRIGTNAAGTAAVPNREGIVAMGAGTGIGGSLEGSGNIIAGNTGTGITMLGSGPTAVATNNTVSRNRIGVGADGSPLPNGSHGILLLGVSANLIGHTIDPQIANDISNNGGDGVAIIGDAQALNNVVVGNHMANNAGLAIDLADDGPTPNDPLDADAGPNLLQNHPVIQSVTRGPAQDTLQISMDTVPLSSIAIDIYSVEACDPSGFGETGTFLNTVTANPDATGHASIVTEVPRAASGIYVAVARFFAQSSSEVSPCATASQPFQVFVVTTAADGGGGSLREAITLANAHPNNASTTDQIEFAVPGGGVHTIQLLSPLPTITDPVVIDGTTQPGFSGIPVIELDGTLAGATADGLSIAAGFSTVRGLAINRFGTGGVGPGGRGIVLTTGGNRISGNFIGTDPTGTTQRANRGDGVWVQGSANIVGGITVADRNVISGNGNRGLVVSAGVSNEVSGNYVGTDATGSLAVANSGAGIVVLSSNNIVGGTTPGAGNIVSGNGGQGIIFQGTDNIAQGNFVGTSAAGTEALPNAQEGIFLTGLGHTVGGTVAGARNVISGNGWYGISIQFNSQNNVVQGNFIGTDATGTASLGNTFYGVFVSGGQSNLIGGATAEARNVISGNQVGVFVAGASSADNEVLGNYIGTTASGAGALGNSSFGVRLTDGASDNIIGGTNPGMSNLIMFNGVGVGVESGTGNRIVGNSISSNTNLGIDLAPAGVTQNDAGDSDVGANNLQNFLVLNDARVIGNLLFIDATLDSIAGRTYTVEYFRGSSCATSGFGEGQTLVGRSLVTPTSTPRQIADVFPAVPVGEFLTATVTSTDGTSEFSSCIVVRIGE